MTFDELLSKSDADTKKWLLFVFQQAADKMKLGRLQQLIEQGNVERIIEELGLTQSGLAPFADAVERSFLTGATFQAQLGGGVFDKWTDGVQQLLRQRAKDATLGIYTELGSSLTSTIQQGLLRGSSTQKIANDILGLRSAGKRSGGALGLSTVQTRWAASAADELDLLDPNYLSRALRDRRFDRAFRKAMATRTPLTEAVRAKMVNAYRERLLHYRADVVARTETLGAMNAGRYEAATQDAERLGLDATAVEATWRSHQDARTRDSHRPMNGQTVVKGSPFISGNGARMLFPGDTSQGAGAADTINCRCTVTFRIRRNNG